MILVIDNYDSFTFNLVQAFYELGAAVEVVRNDFIDVAGIRAKNPSHLVISPGPCTPKEAGVSVEAIRALSGTLPILGVCLGHQAIGYAFGGEVVRARRVMHGKTSLVKHEERGLFTGIKNPMPVGRYHSLAVETAAFPGALEITATTTDPEDAAGSVEVGPKTGTVMALRHREHPTVGVQFHPESVLTPDGGRLLSNFLEGRLC